MSPLPPAFCPVCNKSGRSMPVEAIYFSLLENNIENENLKNQTTSQKKDLFKYLAPPGSRNQRIWQILPPDILFGVLMVVLLFTAIIGYMDGRLDPAGAITPFALLFLIYALFRTRIQAAFLRNREKREKHTAKLSERTIEWSQAQFCFEDRVIFFPDQSTYTLIEFFQTMHVPEIAEEDEVT